jgi:hypothetical protein
MQTDRASEHAKCKAKFAKFSHFVRNDIKANPKFEQIRNRTSDIRNQNTNFVLSKNLHHVQHTKTGFTTGACGY